MQLRNLFKRKPKPPVVPQELKKLSAEELEAFIEAFNQHKQAVVEGDGNATFLEPMTDDEYAKWMHEQEHGWGKVYKKLLGRKNEDG